jgi:hypothetical protein
VLYLVHYPLDFELLVSRESLVFLLGVIVFVIPLIGVPPLWKEYAITIIGILLILVGFSLRRSAYYRKIDRGNGERSTDSFVESLPDRQAGQPSVPGYTTDDAEMDK